jgi:hypothetical protein
MAVRHQYNRTGLNINGFNANLYSTLSELKEIDLFHAIMEVTLCLLATMQYNL